MKLLLFLLTCLSISAFAQQPITPEFYRFGRTPGVVYFEGVELVPSCMRVENYFTGSDQNALLCKSGDPTYKGVKSLLIKVFSEIDSTGINYERFDETRVEYAGSNITVSVTKKDEIKENGKTKEGNKGWYKIDASRNHIVETESANSKYDPPLKFVYNDDNIFLFAYSPFDSSNVPYFGIGTMTITTTMKDSLLYKTVVMDGDHQYGQTWYTYENGRIIRIDESFPSTSEDRRRCQVVFSYSPEGKLISKVRACQIEGSKWKVLTKYVYSYHASGQLKEILVDDKVRPVPYPLVRYNEKGQVLELAALEMEGSTVLTYDAQGLLIKATLSAKKPLPFTVEQTVKNNRVTKTKKAVYDDIETITVVYDTHGYPIKTSNSEGKVVSTMENVYDSKGHWTSIRYLSDGKPFFHIKREIQYQ